MTGRQTRFERAAYPLARDSIRKIAESVGGCLRPVQLRRTDTVTGEVTQVLIPCGATLGSICPPCAERGKALRATQCREGWHLEDEPDLSPAAPDETQEYWLTLRAEAQACRDRAADRGKPVAELGDLIAELDTEITRVGVRGTVTTTRDALHFAALVDRFIQNLRRALGYEAQYFGTVEPQRRLATHLHMAIRLGAGPASAAAARGVD